MMMRRNERDCVNWILAAQQGLAAAVSCCCCCGGTVLRQDLVDEYVVGRTGSTAGAAVAAVVATCTVDAAADTHMMMAVGYE
jgi:hypothetical protein